MKFTHISASRIKEKQHLENLGPVFEKANKRIFILGFCILLRVLYQGSSNNLDNKSIFEKYFFES
jgi:hypothetical protein